MLCCPAFLLGFFLVQKELAAAARTQRREIADSLESGLRLCLCLCLIVIIVVVVISQKGFRSDGRVPIHQALVVKDVRAVRIGRPGHCLVGTKGVEADRTPTRASRNRNRNRRGLCCSVPIVIVVGSSLACVSLSRWWDINCLAVGSIGIVTVTVFAVCGSRSRSTNDVFGVVVLVLIGTIVIVIVIVIALLLHLDVDVDIVIVIAILNGRTSISTSTSTRTTSISIAFREIVGRGEWYRCAVIGTSTSTTTAATTDSSICCRPP
mmetsp:Transcript_15177/g.32615  ORF Transcript_15177/g.32615 Transcript_15177/m.32615 type:complete len:265 (+) Transcript_15177:288-1082(+)